MRSGSVGARAPARPRFDFGLDFDFDIDFGLDFERDFEIGMASLGLAMEAMRGDRMPNWSPRNAQVHCPRKPRFSSLW